jgi:UDP-N-acetylglucosamine 2-epimerase (non-hydrolysing)
VKIVSLVGARPQFVKLAIVAKALNKYNVEHLIVHSGQHYDVNMSDIFFDTLEIPKAQYNLEVGSDTHARQTAKIMERFEELLMKENPDRVIVYGDTNTTIAGALVCAKLKIPLAHVEAGLRQKPKDMPEEINRVVTDHISQFLFAPSQLAVDNLKFEGVEKGVYFTGDVMFDLFLLASGKLKQELKNNSTLDKERFVLFTLHRDFNTDIEERLVSILEGVSQISKKFKVIFPIHPRTRKCITEKRIENLLDSIYCIEPIDYLTTIKLLSKCEFVITDTGGLQKEAYFAGKRALVLMPDTGWRELTNCEWNILVDADKDRIIRGFEQIISKTSIPSAGLYGDGDAGSKIAKILINSILE